MNPERARLAEQHEDERARARREAKLRKQIVDDRARVKANLTALLPSVREVPSDFEGCVW